MILITTMTNKAMWKFWQVHQECQWLKVLTELLKFVETAVAKKKCDVLMNNESAESDDLLCAKTFCIDDWPMEMISVSPVVH